MATTGPSQSTIDASPMPIDQIADLNGYEQRSFRAKPQQLAPGSSLATSSTRTHTDSSPTESRNPTTSSQVSRR
jgi:hypothetical protein